MEKGEQLIRAKHLMCNVLLQESIVRNILVLKLASYTIQTLASEIYQFIKQWITSAILKRFCLCE